LDSWDTKIINVIKIYAGEILDTSKYNASTSYTYHTNGDVPEVVVEYVNDYYKGYVSLE
jgi:hypothetical protein